MIHINTFNESIYKNLKSDDHITNIEDILAEFSDNGINIRVVKNRNKGKQTPERTFSVYISLSENLVRKILNNYHDDFDLIYRHPKLKTYYTKSYDGILDRLDRFGYRLYKEDTNSDLLTRWISVTYRPNKMKR